MLKRLDALLTVAFGTAEVQRFDRCFAALHQAAVQRFVGLTCEMALTSPRIQAKLARQGMALPLVEEALASLQASGCRRVVVLSLFFANGKEWEKLGAQIESWRSRFDELILTPPLLTHSLTACAQTLSELFPVSEKPRILLGHGQSQGCNDDYSALQQVLDDLHRSDLRIALLHGEPSLMQSMNALRMEGCRSASLNFLMLCAGHHAAEISASVQNLTTEEVSLSLDISSMELGACPDFQQLFLTQLDQVLSSPPVISDFIL